MMLLNVTEHFVDEVDNIIYMVYLLHTRIYLYSSMYNFKCRI